MKRPRDAARRRTVARRVLLSYAIIMVAFAAAAGWSVVAARRSAREASLMRDGYLPLALAVRDLVANQDTWNTQLNHITSARNPADKRVWFETAINVGRPKKFGEVRAKISRAFVAQGDESARLAGERLLQETGRIRDYLAGDNELVEQLFVSLDHAHEARAERLRDELVTRGFQGKRRLSQLEGRVAANVDLLLDQARGREALGIRLLVLLVSLTLAVGIAMVIYARRVLAPLAHVTERAKAVAQGDLTPRAALSLNDEIGELSATFESMVSAIAEANEQLLAAERLAVIGKMAAHVTHEIRNPLSSIALNLELLEEELGEGDHEARALVRAITKEVERLEGLSGQYLSVAKRRELLREEGDAGEVIRSACEFMRGDVERHGIRLEVHVDKRLPLVLVDDAQLKQALFNLIRNARESMDRGGAIAVSVHAVEGGVEIVVDDEGSGIDEAARESLFDPFFSTKSHGTGLGLAITRQIVEAHRGSIRCELRETGGTRFAIVLPAIDSEAEPSDERATA